MHLDVSIEHNRRAFLRHSVAAGIVLSTIGVSASSCAKEKEEKETTPNEDLMREHGLLDRLLLVYEQNLKKDFNIKYVQSAAKIIHDFIENYHEKLEEEFIFPILEKKKETANLVATLKTQHQIGRKITDRILSRSGSLSSQEKTSLEQDISAFISMYRAHASREDTILFPSFKDAISDHRYKELGELFEEREHKLFGEDGFKTVLSQVEALEVDTGISNLDIYTARPL
jgi:hemerythrin-like domain-containing protein